MEIHFLGWFCGVGNIYLKPRFLSPELTLPQFYSFLHEMERVRTSMECFSWFLSLPCISTPTPHPLLLFPGDPLWERGCWAPRPVASPLGLPASWEPVCKVSEKQRIKYWRTPDRMTLKSLHEAPSTTYLPGHCLDIQKGDCMQGRK